jgi:hypothetical protein
MSKPSKTMTFQTTCIDSTAEIINQVVETEQEITFSTFLSFIDLSKSALNEFLGYTWMSIDKDWAVHYFKSFYLGKPCVFVRWSAIEYIFA